jgi:hypothetical protein
MTKRFRFWFAIILVVLSVSVLVYTIQNRKLTIDQWRSVGRPPRIHPDYSGAVIPPNIAPLNFLVEENGLSYCVKIYSKQGKPFEVFGRSPKIVIPLNKWHKLLNTNRGQQLYFDVFVKTEGDQWNLFSTITNTIAREDIDSFLVYRIIRPVYQTGETAIYQRNLRSYDDRPVLHSKSVYGACLNCHTFYGNRPDKMVFGVRSQTQGSSTILVQDGKVYNVGTKFGYTSWHPSGRLAVYSINKVRQFFHFAGNEVRDVVDLDSALLYYLPDSRTVKTSPKISKKDSLETFPTWSPDGHYLYFCTAPILWSDRNKLPPEHYDEVKYDLVRISYELESDKWGELETVLSSQDTGLSILEPRISPDGRWLLFCMCEYSCWASYHAGSDLYLIDLKAAQETGRYEYRRLDINSDQSETWHCWSSNSRWIAFSSKKGNGLFTRTYLAYVDEAGRFYKPILLPQKDPLFYDSCLWTHGVPELIIEPLKTTGEKLAKVVRSSHKIEIDMPITMATPRAGTSPGLEEPYQERE